MHQTFAGNSRRVRQVNLSGRSNANPWAALSNTSKASQPATGTQSTIANAQAGRAQRQLERQKLTAAKILQRSWRGHSSRQKMRQRWREQWDTVEDERIQNDQPANTRYESCVDGFTPVQKYDSVELCYLQFKLLVHFLDVKDQMDRLRALYFGEVLATTIRDGESRGSLVKILHRNQEACRICCKLGSLVARSLNTYQHCNEGRIQDVFLAKHFRMIGLLGKLMPASIVQNAEIYFEDVAESCSDVNHGLKFHAAAIDLLAILLTPGLSDIPRIYKAYVSHFLSTLRPSEDSQIMAQLVTRTDLSALANALLTESRHARDGGAASETSVRTYLRRLAYFVHLKSRQKTSTDARDAGHEIVKLEALSYLLGQSANEIARRLHVEDEHMTDSESPRIGPRLQPLPPFVRRNVASLAQQLSIVAIMSDLDMLAPSKTQGSSISDTVVATNLARYAVALFRAFPDKAMEIRKWLYQGSMRSTSSQEVATIQYFWNAARATSVFRGIYKGQRNVLTILKEPSMEHNQIGRPQPMKGDLELWRDEWQVILFFFEMYTAVLTPMHDEEFFLLEDIGQRGSVPRSALLYGRGALPLEEISRMTVFLKHLAFTLYWNASDLSHTNSFEEAGGLSAYFGTEATVVSPKPTGTSQSKTQSLAGMDGLSQAYLKGLVTGILRMLHERDSRRKFLPENHWLMTTHVDMAGFIPAVVAEEEKRHELGDDMQDEEEDIDEYLHEHESGFATTAESYATPVSRLPEAVGRSVTSMGRLRNARHAELVKRKQELAYKKRQLASLAPRLEILRNLPFFIPFETRVQIFREFIKHDQIRRRDGFIDPDTWRMHTAMGMGGRSLFDERHSGREAVDKHRADVHRDSIFQDAFSSFFELGEGLKEPIQISFIDKFGNPEAGIDGGGVTKEFLTSITNEAFEPQGVLGMFVENDQHEIYPNPNILENMVEQLRRMRVMQGTKEFKQKMVEFLQQYEFLGRIVGKCMYEGILVDISFAGFFLLKWALTGGTTAASNETAYRASINDVKDFDKELYQGLLQLKNYPGDVEADFSLNFSVTDTISIDVNGKEVTKLITRDLIPGGSNTPVNNGNRLLYIDRIARYRLQTQPKAVTDAFLRGLGQIIQPMWMAMFNQIELQTLVGGENSELDIADLRRNTQYNGLYQIGDDGLEHPTIAMFWQVLRKMSDEDRRKLLKFVTSTPRAPLLGFSNLSPPFTIHSTSAHEGLDRLPSTSTCVNLLKLPNYRDEKTMREKLLYAANSGAGFDLS